MSGISVTGLDGSTRSLDGEAIEGFRQTLRGELLLSDDGRYDDVRRIWNGVHDKRPAMIIRATGTADVIDTVNFARENGLLLSIRGGGHNVAGTSLADGAVLLDLSGLRGVRVDPEERIAYVEPGARLGDLDRETQAFALVAPAGVVSTTGVAGLTLGGGMGWVRRKYGLSIDNLLSVDIITADGVFRRASETENEDLFWAIRGGGGNFGVVTSFRFRLHPLGPIVYLAAPMYPLENGYEVALRWRDFCRDAPDEVSSFLLIQTLPEAEVFPKEAWGRKVVVLATMYAGAEFEGEKVLQPLREFGEPLVDLSGPIPFRALQGAFDWVFPEGSRYYWKTATLAELDEEAINTVIELGNERPSPAGIVGIWQMGGAVSRIADDATGYGPRSDPWTVAIDNGWSDPADDERQKAFTREACERISRLSSSGGMYLHYGEVEKAEQIRQAYGANYDRLVEIKRKYDPMNLFRINQNIRPEQVEVAE